MTFGQNSGGDLAQQIRRQFRSKTTWLHLEDPKWTEST